MVHLQIIQIRILELCKANFFFFKHIFKFNCETEIE